MLTNNISSIRRRTALVQILLVILLIVFAYWGYQESIWIVWVVCLGVLPFAAWNAYQYLLNAEFRKSLNQYHDEQKGLPKEERDGYGIHRHHKMVQE